MIEIAGFQLQALEPLPNVGKGCQMQDGACNLLQNVRIPRFNDEASVSINNPLSTFEPNNSFCC